MQYYQIPEDPTLIPPEKDAFDLLIEELYLNSLTPVKQTVVDGMFISILLLFLLLF